MSSLHLKPLKRYKSRLEYLIIIFQEKRVPRAPLTSLTREVSETGSHTSFLMHTKFLFLLHPPHSLCLITVRPFLYRNQFLWNIPASIIHTAHQFSRWICFLRCLNSS